MQEIKNCPHCNASAHLYSNKVKQGRTHFVYVKCSLCGAQTRTFSNGDSAPADDEWETSACYEAVEAWNTRYH